MKEFSFSSYLVLCSILLMMTLWGPGTGDLTAGEGGDSTNRPALKLDYFANEGVMITIGAKKILIDALYDKPNPDYRAPSPEVLKKVIAGQSPFNEVDLILFSHGHADHFDAGVVAKVMESRSDPILVVPADVLPDLKKAVKNWDKITSRVISLDLKIGGKIRKTFGGITVDAFRTRHSGDREMPHNLIYVIAMEGWRMIHEGDSDGRFETYQKLGLGKDHIDLALVHFWFPLDPGGKKILHELLVPDHIGLIHLPIKYEGEAPTWINKEKTFYKDIFLLLPGSKPRTFK